MITENLSKAERTSFLMGKLQDSLKLRCMEEYVMKKNIFKEYSWRIYQTGDKQIALLLILFWPTHSRFPEHSVQHSIPGRIRCLAGSTAFGQSTELTGFHVVSCRAGRW